MRLYRGQILRYMKFCPAYNGDDSEFRYQLIGTDRRVETYIAPTIDDIFSQLRAAGHQVWGKDTLDYALPPQNALEYLLMTEQLKREGYTDDEIAREFRIGPD